MPGTSLKTLIFDLDDTLVVEKASAAAAFLETCQLATSRYSLDPETLHQTVRETCRELWYYHSPARSYAVDVGISSWEALWSRFQGDNEHLAAFRDWAPYYRRQSWRNALLRHKIDDINLAEELAETFPVRRRDRHVVYPDVHLALEELRRSFRLALLTNGASDLQREKIDGAGIGPYFEETLVAGDIGVAKPNARMFTTILERLDTEPNKALMLGDSLSKDIRGAQAVGLKAVWINRAGAPRHDGITPDLEVADLQKFQKTLVTDHYFDAL